MRIRDSEMPPEEDWAKLFNPDETLRKLGLNAGVKDVADFGCGYGTFTLPAAHIIRGKIYAIDIDPQMIKTVEQKAKQLNLKNVVTVLRDFVEGDSGLKKSSVDFVFLFNILHAENPVDILKEAYRTLKKAGKAAIIHWKPEIAKTLTEDSKWLEILPKPEQCLQWAEDVGFHFEKQLDLKPYHYGLLMGQ